jgi:hypothetical protein
MKIQQNALDLDQKAFMALVDAKNATSYVSAKKVYEEGGNVGSYATFSIGWPWRRLYAGSLVTGTSVNGGITLGRVLYTVGMFATEIKVAYVVSGNQTSYVNCQVGGLVVPNLSGCK